jgi:uncharacterized protein YcfJ
MKLTKEQKPEAELVQVVDAELNEEQLEAAAGGGILGAIIGGTIGAIVGGPGGAIIGATAGHVIEEAIH